MSSIGIGRFLVCFVVQVVLGLFRQFSILRTLTVSNHILQNHDTCRVVFPNDLVDMPSLGKAGDVAHVWIEAGRRSCPLATRPLSDAWGLYTGPLCRSGVIYFAMIWAATVMSPAYGSASTQSNPKSFTTGAERSVEIRNARSEVLGSVLGL